MTARKWQPLIVAINFRLLTWLAVAVLWVILFRLNDLFFEKLAVSALVSWIFLPAGLRLLSILVFRRNAVFGLFIGSLITTSNIGMSLENTLIISLISAVNPYFAYLVSNALLNINTSLNSLTTKQLLLLSITYAMFNAVSHNFYFYFTHIHDEFFISTIKMFIGDLVGSLVMLYLFSFAIRFTRKSILREQ